MSTANWNYRREKYSNCLLFPKCVCVFVNSTIPNCSLCLRDVLSSPCCSFWTRDTVTLAHISWVDGQLCPGLLQMLPLFCASELSESWRKPGSWPAERTEVLIQKFVFNLGCFSLIYALSVNFFSKFLDYSLKLGLQMLVCRQKCTWACHQPVPPKGFLCSWAAKWGIAYVHSNCWCLSEHSRHCCRISGKRKLVQMLLCYFILLLYLIYEHCRYNLKTIETWSSFLVDGFFFVIPCLSLLDIIFLNHKIFGLLMCVSKAVGAV